MQSNATLAQSVEQRIRNAQVVSSSLSSGSFRGFFGIPFFNSLLSMKTLSPLPGTKADREIILMAHIDTRVIKVMDSTSFAPGADAITAFLPPKKGRDL